VNHWWTPIHHRRHRAVLRLWYCEMSNVMTDLTYVFSFSVYYHSHRSLILLNGWICLHIAWCVKPRSHYVRRRTQCERSFKLSRLLVGFRTHLKSMHFHFISLPLTVGPMSCLPPPSSSKAKQSKGSLDVGAGSSLCAVQTTWNIT